MGVLEINEITEEILQFRLNRPGKLNAMNEELLVQLIDAFEEAAADERSVVIVEGAGDAFTSGIDLDEVNEDGGYVDLLQELTRVTYGFPGVIIGKLDGYVVGGGFEFTLSFDLRYASEETTILMTESEIGATISNASTKLLPLYVGYGVAKELIITGRPVEAEEAHELGIINKVYESDQLETEVMDIATEIVENKSRKAIRLNKKGFANEYPIEQALEYERMIDIERQLLEEEIARKKE